MLTVMRRSHLNSYPQLRSAARMRPSLSLIEESGRPSIVNFGKPEAVSASTRTRCASTPRTAAVSDVASIRTPRVRAQDRAGIDARGVGAGGRDRRPAEPRLGPQAAALGPTGEGGVRTGRAGAATGACRR